MIVIFTMFYCLSDLSCGESTHPPMTDVKSQVFYGVESVVRGNADSLLN